MLSCLFAQVFKSCELEENKCFVLRRGKDPIEWFLTTSYWSNSCCRGSLFISVVYYGDGKVETGVAQTESNSASVTCEEFMFVWFWMLFLRYRILRPLVNEELCNKSCCLVLSSLFKGLDVYLMLFCVACRFPWRRMPLCDGVCKSFIQSIYNENQGSDCHYVLFVSIIWIFISSTNLTFHRNVFPLFIYLL